MVCLPSARDPSRWPGLHDSPMEGDGFEPSVPQQIRSRFRESRIAWRFDRLATRNWKFESISLQQTVCLSPASAFEGREPGFRRGFARMAWRPRRQRRRDVLISLRRAARLCRAEFQYRSEADVVATVPGRSGRSQDLSGLSIGKSLKFGSGLSKTEHGPLIVPGKRQTGVLEELLCRQFGRLPPIEDGLSDIRREIAEADEPREIGPADPFPVGESSYRSTFPRGECRVEAARPEEQLDQSRVRFRGKRIRPIDHHSDLPPGTTQPHRHGQKLNFVVVHALRWCSG